MGRWSGAKCADDEFGSDMVGGRAGGLRCLLRFQLMVLTRFDEERRVFAEVGRGAKKWPKFDEQLVPRFLP